MSTLSSHGWPLNADAWDGQLLFLVRKDVTLVCHSTGGGEVARYIGRHGTERVAKAVLISAIPPPMLKTPANPEGLPMEAFDRIRGDPTG
jgi:non-heme chloroperoxidase